MAHLIQVTETSKGGNVYVTPKIKLIGTAFQGNVINQGGITNIYPLRGTNIRTVTQTVAEVETAMNLQSSNAPAIPLTVLYEIGYEDVNYPNVLLNFDPSRVVEVFQYAPSQVYIEYAPNGPAKYDRKYYVVSGSFQTVKNALTAADFTGTTVADQINIKVIYDFSVDGGAIGSIPTGIFIPNGYAVKRSYYNVFDQFTSATDAAEIGVSANAVGDIVVPIAISDVSNPWDPGNHDGNQTGSASTITGAADDDGEITINISAQAVTAGIAIFYIECLRLP